MSTLTTAVHHYAPRSENIVLLLYIRHASPAIHAKRNCYIGRSKYSYLPIGSFSRCGQKKTLFDSFSLFLLPSTRPSQGRLAASSCTTRATLPAKTPKDPPAPQPDWSSGRLRHTPPNCPRQAHAQPPGSRRVGGGTRGIIQTPVAASVVHIHAIRNAKKNQGYGIKTK